MDIDVSHRLFDIHFMSNFPAVCSLKASNLLSVHFVIMKELRVNLVRQ